MGIFDSIGKKIEARQDGIKVSDLLSLPRGHRALMNRVIRERELTFEAAVEHLGLPPEQVREMLNDLVENGYLKSEEKETGPIYRVHYGRTDPKEIPGSLWAALGEKIED